MPEATLPPNADVGQIILKHDGQVYVMKLTAIDLRLLVLSVGHAHAVAHRDLLSAIECAMEYTKMHDESGAACAMFRQFMATVQPVLPALNMDLSGPGTDDS